MTRHPTILRAVVTGLLCLLALITAPAVTAQTITNIAQANWQQAGQVVTAQSNAVSFSRMSSTATITTFAAGPGASTSLTFMPSQCGGVPIAVSSNAATATQIASVAQTTTVQIGSVFYFEVNAPQANTNPAVVESIQVLLTTNGGDREILTVFETAPNTGVFIGAIPTAAVPPQPAQGDCQLSVAIPDIIRKAMTSSHGPTTCGARKISLPLAIHRYIGKKASAAPNGAGTPVRNPADLCG